MREIIIHIELLYRIYSNSKHLNLTYRLVLLHLKHTLVIFTQWCVVIYVLHQDNNLHGWIYLSVVVILCQNHQDVLKTEPTVLT